jgi:hypothetical protein
MKRIGSVVSLSFLVLFLLVSCVNSPSDSVKNSDNNDWVNYIDDDNGNVYSYKKGNVKKDKEDYIVQVWGKVVFSDEGKEEEIQLLTKYGVSTEGYDKLSKEIILGEIDCNKLMISILFINHYDTDGKLLHSESYDKPVWNDVIPDSNGELLLKKVCE